MLATDNKGLSWVLFLVLSLIWGSSFILMKRGMYSSTGEPLLSANQVATLRILSAGLVLLPRGISQLRLVPARLRWLILLSALLGSFIPAYLFCTAETRIDSSLAGFLNALTPVFTVVLGMLFFKTPTVGQRLLGVVVAFGGMLLLFLSGEHINLEYLSYSALVVLATISYAINVNMVNRHLKAATALNIAAIGFSLLVLPCLLILAVTGYFSLPLSSPSYLLATLSSVTLGIMGTAVATVLFYLLLKRAGPLFSSMVTYGIPFIALGWGLLDGESIRTPQVLGLAIILTGVYLTSKRQGT